jgi:hypothetical protein
MAGERERGAAGASAFDGVDPRLTIYALANGMDLVKDEAFRRLEWYRDGMDRGIRVSVTPAGTLEVTALVWSGDPEGARTAPVGDAVAPDELAHRLSGILDGAAEAANAL